MQEKLIAIGNGRRRNLYGGVFFIMVLTACAGGDRYEFLDTIDFGGSALSPPTEAGDEALERASAPPDAESTQKTKAPDEQMQPSEPAVCTGKGCHETTDPLEALEKAYEDEDEFDGDIRDGLIDDLDKNIEDELDDD